MFDYSAKVKEHFMNPRNVGEMEEPSGVGKIGNPICGDIMELYIKVDEGVIIDAKFKTFGCGAAIAASSMVTEIVRGKSVGEALKISCDEVAGALDGLPPVKKHCSVLGVEALQKALADYRSKVKE